jgi:hypothetical protein
MQAVPAAALIAEISEQSELLLAALPTVAAAVESMGANGYVSPILRLPVPFPEPTGAQIWLPFQFVWGLLCPPGQLFENALGV